MNKKLNKIPLAGTKADSEQKDEDMQVIPAIAKPNVVCSQSPSSVFTVFNLLDTICDGLIGYKAQIGNLYSVKTTLELPESSFNRLVSELKTASTSIDETEILYGGFKFCVKKCN
jgi:hypothetical protein